MRRGCNLEDGSVASDKRVHALLLAVGTCSTCGRDRHLPRRRVQRGDHRPERGDSRLAVLRSTGGKRSVIRELGRTDARTVVVATFRFDNRCRRPRARRGRPDNGHPTSPRLAAGEKRGDEHRLTDGNIPYSRSRLSLIPQRRVGTIRVVATPPILVVVDERDRPITGDQLLSFETTRAAEGCDRSSRGERRRVFGLGRGRPSGRACCREVERPDHEVE